MTLICNRVCKKYTRIYKDLGHMAEYDKELIIQRGHFQFCFHVKIVYLSLKVI